MITKNTYSISLTPKNYARKGTICSHLCYISLGDKQFEYVKIKYEVEPGEGRAPIHQKKGKHSPVYQNWGTFKKIIEMPEAFSQLDEEDFTIMISSFHRDNVLMPCIGEIIIKNIEKYKNIKLKLSRKGKLFKIKDNE
jgi:hypothetical protein